MFETQIEKVKQGYRGARALVKAREERELPAWQRPLWRTIRILAATTRDITEGQLSLRAMSLVYTTLLSLVPLLAVSFSVLKGFGVHNQIRPMLLGLLEPLGDQGETITQEVIGFVDNVEVGVLGSVGLALLFYTIISLMRKIENAFNYSWHVSRPRAFAQGFTNYISIILIGPVLVFSSLGITASIASDPLVERISAQPVIETLVFWGGRILPYLMVVLAFMLLYMFMPNTRVKARPALIGAAVAGLLWQTAGLGITELIASSPNYTAIYSAFATLVVFMIWLYLSWLILLFGASLAFYVQNPRFAMVGHRNFQLSSRFREAMALAVVKIIGQRFQVGQENTSAVDLSRDLGVPNTAVQWALDSLLKKRLIRETAGDPRRGESAGYVPGRAMDSIRLQDVLEAVRAAGENDMPFLQRLREDPELAELADAIERGQSDAIGGRSLQDIAVTDEGKRSDAPDGPGVPPGHSGEGHT